MENRDSPLRLRKRDVNRIITSKTKVTKDPKPEIQPKINSIVDECDEYESILNEFSSLDIGSCLSSTKLTIDDNSKPCTSASASADSKEQDIYYEENDTESDNELTIVDPQSPVLNKNKELTIVSTQFGRPKLCYKG